MRALYSLLLSSVLILAAACSPPKHTASPAPIPEATAGPYRLGSPVETKIEAVSVGSQLLQAPGFKWIGSPRVVLAEQMTYAEANTRMGLGEAQYDVWPEETSVWLVVFQGQWKLIPVNPATPSPPSMSYEGCVMTIFAARDGSLISKGDAVCPAPQ
jgi:hypothetical protein